MSFAPGFRLSIVDCCVLAIGLPAAAYLWTLTWWWGFVPAFVLLHFFLFCNVFRIARALELIWGTIFVALAGATIALDVPGWPVTIPLTLLTTIIVIALEMRKPSYHGILWQRINPGLRAWWESNGA